MTTKPPAAMSFIFELQFGHSVAAVDDVLT